MIEHGYLRLLAGDLSGLENYWRNLLLDFPAHPCHGHESQSIPLTLYGVLVGCVETFLFCGFVLFKGNFAYGIPNMGCIIVRWFALETKAGFTQVMKETHSVVVG